MTDFSKSVSQRFIRYTKFDTMSEARLAGVRRPSTEGQEVFMRHLVGELEELGLEAGYMEEGVVHAVMEANVPSALPVAFLAHVDTSSDVNGNGVRARVVHYEGGDIELAGSVISSKENPDLLLYCGQDIITSDGTSLLGADDKAGVAEIMEALSFLSSHPEIGHGPVEVFFTPDEETGHGMDGFPYDSLLSRICYTVDGGSRGEFETGNFNAATVRLEIEGVAVHPGYARGRLVNALSVASSIASAIHSSESPEATDQRYGYYHVTELEGSVEKSSMEIIIRDHDREKFDFRIEALKDLALAICKIRHAKVDINVEMGYSNMARYRDCMPETVDAVFEAARRLGLELKEEWIRGGTDGAVLAERMKLPCPNLFTGGYNFHSLQEWIPVSAMSDAVNLILGIICHFARRPE